MCLFVWRCVLVFVGVPVEMCACCVYYAWSSVFVCVCVCFWVCECVCIGLCLYIACLVACREFSFGIQCICVCLLCKLCTRQCLCVHVLCMCKQVLSMCVCTCVCLCQCVCVHILCYLFIIKTILCVTNKSHFGILWNGQLSWLLPFVGNFIMLLPPLENYTGIFENHKIWISQKVTEYFQIIFFAWFFSNFLATFTIWG